MRQLSDGVDNMELSAQVVAPKLGALLARVRWPSAYATFDIGAMVIRESTHRHSPLSIHRAMIGRARPLLRSALGRAAVAAATEEDRERMLEFAIKTQQPDAAEAGCPSYVRQVVEEYRKNGYASSVDGSEKGISAIALAVCGPTPILGAVNIIFFTRVLDPREAARRHLRDLREAVEEIEESFRIHPDLRPPD